jgi:hypothetical protein
METQNEVTSETLASLATTAATVATQHEAFTAALATQNEAEAALLERIIDTVKPALRALACQIKKYDFSTSGNNGCNPVRRYDTFDEVGVMLVDDFDREKDAPGTKAPMAVPGCTCLAMGAWRKSTARARGHAGKAPQIPTRPRSRPWTPPMPSAPTTSRPT